MTHAARLSYARAAIALTMSALCARSAAAQNEAALKAFFEGRRVTVQIDMPGSSDGVDVHADAKQSVDFGRVRDNLKRYGTAIRSGDSITVTLVKVKKDLIEFQLGGGGYGTFGDDTSTSVYIPDAPKTEREKQLEKRVKEEDDRSVRRKLEAELDELRNRRERENRRIEAERERQSAIKAERIAERRLHGGSRFNLRYDDAVPNGIRPQDVMAALADYADFRSLAPDSMRHTGDELVLPPRLRPPRTDVRAPRRRSHRHDARLCGRGSADQRRVRRRRARPLRRHFEVVCLPCADSRLCPRSSPREISSRRPRDTCSGGAGTVISRTPSLKFAFA
jgi:hypothetical protein